MCLSCVQRNTFSCSFVGKERPGSLTGLSGSNNNFHRSRIIVRGYLRLTGRLLHSESPFNGSGVALSGSKSLAKFCRGAHSTSVVDRSRLVRILYPATLFCGGSISAAVLTLIHQFIDSAHDWLGGIGVDQHCGANRCCGSRPGSSPPPRTTAGSVRGSVWPDRPSRKHLHGATKPETPPQRLKMSLGRRPCTTVSPNTFNKASPTSWP